MKNNNIRKKVYECLLVIVIVVCMLLFQHINPLYNIDNLMSDRLYQTGNLQSGRIQIIEINEESFEYFGPYQTWDRHIIAEAIDTLVSDDENLPAVIGVDLLYIGETSEDADEALIEACQKAKDLGVQVVLGSFANMERGMVTYPDGSISIEDYVSLYEEPFSEVRDITMQGFTNGTPDEDGSMRRVKLAMDISGQNRGSDKETRSSFAASIYQAFKGAAYSDTVCDKEYYIPYTGVADSYSNGFSISGLIFDEVPLERLADKIVLIGPYAEGMLDSFNTPIDHGNSMYGVEIHANIIESMLRGDLKTQLPDIGSLIITFLFLGLMIVLCKLDKMWITVASGLGLSMIYIGLCLLLYKLGFVTGVFYVPFLLIILAVGNIIRHYIQARLARRQVENTFKRYVAPEIVDQIAKDGLDSIKLGGSTLNIACLFVDIRGFTTMSESLPPETVVEILNRYLTLTSECVFANGGTLDKFVGDCTMALYNAPLPLDDYVYKAVKTGWDMVKGSVALEQELLEKYGKKVSFGVGVHMGPAVVGNIGSAKRMDYTAIGDTVNTAARLEANAGAGCVLVSLDVVKALGDRIVVESLGNIPLKGKNQDLEVFRVLDIA